MNLKLFFVVLFACSFSYAQDSLTVQEQAKREINIQAGNPFKSLGYTPKIATLSKGKYLEWHGLDSIVRIGSFLYHVKQKQLWAYEPLNAEDNSVLRPEISSRWISPDPLAEEFYEWSPYTFTNNNPIFFTDPDGRMAIPFDSGDCPPNCDTPNFWEQFKSSVSGFAKGIFGGQADAQNLADNGNIGAAQQIDSKIEQQVTDLQTYADAVSIIPGSGLAEGAVKADNGDIGGGLLSLGLGILDVGTGGSAASLKTGAKVAAKGSGTAFRYVTQGEIQATRSTGLLRGGRAGKTYFTKDLYKSGVKAQQRLSLGGTPTHRLEFQILNKPNLLRNGTKVTPITGQPGLGSEFMTIDPVRIRLINVQPLR